MDERREYRISLPITLSCYVLSEPKLSKNGKKYYKVSCNGKHIIIWSEKDYQQGKMYDISVMLYGADVSFRQI